MKNFFFNCRLFFYFVKVFCFSILFATYAIDANSSILRRKFRKLADFLVLHAKKKQQTTNSTDAQLLIPMQTISNHFIFLSSLDLTP